MFDAQDFLYKKRRPIKFKFKFVFKYKYESDGLKPQKIKYFISSVMSFT